MLNSYFKYFCKLCTYFFKYYYYYYYYYYYDHHYTFFEVMRSQTRHNCPAYVSFLWDTGLCKALIPRFYFDSRIGRCQTFNYGGCGGNMNNFKDKKSCEEKCLGEKICSNFLLPFLFLLLFLHRYSSS